MQMFKGGLEGGKWRAAALGPLAIALLVLVLPVPRAMAAGCGNEALHEESPQLADCRAYELVPPDFLNGNGIEQAFDVEAGGNAIVYGTLNAFGEASSSIGGKWVARRSAEGWTSSSLNSPTTGRAPTAYDEPAVMAASTDLSQVLLGSRYPFDSSDQSPYSSEFTPGNGDIYRVSAGGATEWVSHGPSLPEASIFDRGLAGTSADLSRVFFATKEPLAPAAAASEDKNLYEFHDGVVSPVNVRDDGTLIPGGAGAGRGSSITAGYEALNEFSSGSHEQGAPNDPSAVSSDGRVVFFSAPIEEGAGPPQLYARIDGSRTVEVSLCQVKACAGRGAPDGATFIVAAADGSSVVFTSPDVLVAGAAKGGAIYRYDVASAQLTYVAPIDLENTFVESEQVGGVLAVSGGGSYIYLCEGGTSVTVLHEGVKSPVATVLCDARDAETERKAEPSAQRAGGAVAQGNPRQTSDGGYVFTTTAGPDRRAAGERQVEEGAGLVALGEERKAEGEVEEGEGLIEAGRVSEEDGRRTIAEAEAFPYPNGGHPEVYIYEPSSATTHCISCRPDGSAAEGDAYLDADPAEADGQATGSSPTSFGVFVRNLNDSGGRAFFVSSDALVPSDRNGVQDVYEWERTGEGDCTAVSASYSATDLGCVSLVSSGNDPRGAALQGSSASGNDVFFSSYEQLVPADTGTEQQIFDARVEGGLASQHPGAGIACGSEDECRGGTAGSAPSGQVGSNRIFGATASPRGCKVFDARAKKFGLLARRAAKRVHREKRQGRAAKRSQATARKLRKRAKHAASQARICSKRGGGK